MKKYFTTAISLALIAAVLTACGGNDGNVEQTAAEEETAAEVTTTAETEVTTIETEEITETTVEAEVSESEETLETAVTYTYGPFAFEMPAGENSYVEQLEQAGLISEGQLDGTYIDIDEAGNFIICMPGTGSGEVYDIGYPNEEGSMTQEQEDTFTEVFFGEFNEYHSGSKTAVDLNGDGIIEDFENYICAAATCGLNLRGSVADISQ